MIDYVESKMARREYEERIQAMAPVRDYDKWLTSEASQSPSAGAALASLAKSLGHIRHLLLRTPNAAPKDARSTQDMQPVID